MPFKFEDLRVWQKALDLTGDIDQLVKSFPSDEKYVLASQLKCAADSICLNIAGGSTGQTDKEFLDFLELHSDQELKSFLACILVEKERHLEKG